MISMRLRRVTCGACVCFVVSCGGVEGDADEGLGAAVLEHEESELLAASPKQCFASPGVVVASGSTRELKQGAYGPVRLVSGLAYQPTRLVLAGGEYHFRSLDLGDSARIECSTPCSVRVVGRVSAGAYTFVGPRESSCANAADVRLVTSARDRFQHGARSSAMSFGDYAEIDARLRAPYGTLSVGVDATGKADLFAKAIQLSSAFFEDLGRPFDPNDDNPCTVDSCDHASSTPRHDPVPDGATCDDGNACTLGDTCRAGQCDRTPVTCPAAASCHAVPTCNPATGACDSPQLDDGSACSDNDACTSGDACQSGTCLSGGPTVCPLPDTCHVASCRTATGCSYTLVASAACGTNDLAGQTCDSVTGGAKPFGVLTCSADCQFDTAACGAEPPRIVLQCIANMAASFVNYTIDSYGVVVQAPGTTGPTFQVSKRDADALVAAAAALEVSTAGYDVVRGPNQFLNSHNASMKTFGPSQSPTLVASLVDGQSVGYRETIRSRDPAAAVPLRYRCGDL